MTTAIRPMLAVTANLAGAWPAGGFWVQPKFDGLRCLIDPVAGPVTRGGDPIPNPAVRAALADPALIGLDGELTAPGGLEGAQSAFMGSGPAPDGWRFTAFDDLKAFSRPFEARLAALRGRQASLPAFALISPARRLERAQDLAEAFAAVLEDHRAQDPARDLDGFVLRSPAWGYREGRASAFRGELLKVKPMDEGEAVILDVRRRADDAALGALQVRAGASTLWAPLAIGRDQARALWADREGLPGRSAVLRWWGTTGRGALRNAVAVAIRRDISSPPAP